MIELFGTIAIVVWAAVAARVVLPELFSKERPLLRPVSASCPCGATFTGNYSAYTMWGLDHASCLPGRRDGFTSGELYDEAARYVWIGEQHRGEAEEFPEFSDARRAHNRLADSAHDVATHLDRAACHVAQFQHTADTYEETLEL